jgi:hypothetical protein
MTPAGDGGRAPARLWVSSPGGPAGPSRRPQGPGFLTLAAATAVSAVGVVLFVALVAVVLVLALVALVIALVVVAAHRVLFALSPGYRQRRQARGPLRPTTTVIETTARLIDTAKPKRQ